MTTGGVPDIADPATGSRRLLAVRGGLWSAAGQILPALGTAVLSVAAGRYLGSGPLGRQSLIAYVNAASAAVVLVSLRTALLQLGGRLQGAGDTARLRALVRWAVPAHLVVGFVVSAVLVVSGLFANQDRSAWFVIAAVALLDAAAYGLSVRMILAEGWVGVGRLRLVSQLVGPVLGLILLFAGLGITGIFVGDGIAAAGLLVAFSRRYRRFAPPEPPPTLTSRPPVPVGRSYVLFAASGAITQVVSKRVEFVVLVLFSTDAAIGMYSVAFMAVNIVGMIPVGIAAAALPSVAAAEGSGESDRAAHHLKVALRLGTTLSIPVVALLAVLGPSLVLLFYGAEYTTAARLVPLAAMSLLMSVIIGLCSQYWSGRGRLRIVLGTGGVAAVADLAVAFALIPSMDATGAVVANLVGQFALGLGLLVVTVRNLGPVRWRSGGAARSVLVAAGGVAAVLVVELASAQVVPDGAARAGVTLVVGAIAGVTASAVLALRVKLLDPTETEWLAPLLPRKARPVLYRITSN